MAENDQYTERATQTEDDDVAPGDVSETTQALLDAIDDAEVSNSSLASCIIYTRSPTPTTAEEPDESVGISSPPPSMQTTARNIKRPQAVYLRPVVLDAQTLKGTSARVVSLPETVAKYIAQQGAPGRRVVSMPERGSE